MSSKKQKAHAEKLRRFNKRVQNLPAVKKLKKEMFGEPSTGGKKKKKKKAKKKAGAGHHGGSKKKKKKKKAGKKKAHHTARAQGKPSRHKGHTKRGKAYAQEYGSHGWYYNNKRGKFVKWSDGSKAKRDRAKAALRK